MLFSQVLIDEMDDENLMEKIPEIYSSYTCILFIGANHVLVSVYEMELQCNTRSVFKIPNLSFVGGNSMTE